MAVTEIEGNKVVVTMTMAHWSFLQQLEHSYKVAHSIKQGLKECESAPSLSPTEAMNYINSL